jgi:phosphatidylethanolamine/phosphatidyl-N-methylethanolamine N-methyltransferase
MDQKSALNRERVEMKEFTLEDEVESYYRKYYEKIHSSGTLGLANRIMHKRLERNAHPFYRHTLELGSGNFEHFAFVKHKYETYTASDIRKPPKAHIENFLKAHNGNLFQIEDATSLSFSDNTFDRVLAGCLIVHINEVNAVIKEWQRVTKPGGQIDFVVPCDPGLLLRAFRRLISIPHAKKFGVTRKTYETVNSYEHISSFPRTLRLVENEVKNGKKLKISYFPFPFLKSWNLNAFAIMSILDEDVES